MDNEWMLTGEVTDRVSIYDWEEVVERIGSNGAIEQATGTVSCGVLIKVTR